MKIAYDYQIFNLQQYGGISRYICELATQIASLTEFEVKILAGLYINQHLKNCSSDLVVGRSRRDIPKTVKITSQINSQLSLIWYGINRPDVVHETYYSPNYLPRTPVPKSCPTVITVHDMIHEKFSNLAAEDEIVNSKARAIKRADRVICVSNNTKKDLIEILDLEPQRISVIYPGYTLRANNNSDAIAKEIENIIESPYILYVGSRQPYYKNFARLLTAYGNRNQINQNFNLVCFGAEPLSQEEADLMRSLGLNEDKVLYIAGADGILAQLYRHASAFVYPSLYEGFGIPPLEAMSFDCPVVCSNTSSIPEVVGNAAEFFDPEEVESIADSLEKVLFSSKHTKDLIELGKERIKHFSWSACARQTSSVYLSLL
ncbi:MAG: glycosyltransferase family 1 protein [Cyanobacteria bacterium P01_A01_bin.83]